MIVAILLAHAFVTYRELRRFNLRTSDLAMSEQGAIRQHANKAVAERSPWCSCHLHTRSSSRACAEANALLLLGKR
ncbi:MAG: hypothetical protein ABI770_09640 [Sphingomicrobium sp.]